MAILIYDQLLITSKVRKLNHFMLIWSLDDQEENMIRAHLSKV